MTISNLRYPRANCQYPRADIQCRRSDFHCRRVDPYLFVRVLMCDATVSIIRSSLIRTDQNGEYFFACKSYFQNRSAS